jgi:hypothetical protein
VRWWLGLVLALAGCPRGPGAPAPVAHLGRAVPVADASDLLRRVTAANDGYGTMETVHQVAIEIALGKERSEKRSFRGLLAIRRPGSFRLQILGPVGARLLDLLYLPPGRVKVMATAPMLAQSSKLPELAESIARDLAAIYRLDPQPESDRRVVEESIALASGRAPLYELKEYRGATLLRQLTVFAATLAVSRCELADGAGGMRTITYGDYERHERKARRGEPAGALLVPRSIHLAREGDSFYWLAIRVESLILDTALDKRLFVE